MHPHRRPALVAASLAAVVAASVAVAVPLASAQDPSPPSPSVALAAQHLPLESREVSAGRARADAEAARAAAAAARAEAERQAAEAAALAAARAAEAERAARAARARDPRAIARSLAGARGWGDQFGCLDRLWTKESEWRVDADNPTSSAYGIPQALPGSKMASAGADWRTNPETQIRWGLEYIAQSYGGPCAAWSHSQAHNWY